MTNSLGYYNPVFYANEALRWLRKSLGMASRVYMGYDAEHRTFGRGDTINIRRPTSFAAANAPVATPTDLNPDSVQLTLSSWKEVKFKLSDKERSFTGDRIIQEHIAPAAYALADQIDQDILALATQVPHAIYPAGDIAGADGLVVADLTAAHGALFTQKVPMMDPSALHLMVGGPEQQELLANSAFGQWTGAGPTGEQTQITGAMGRRYGLNIFASQNRPSVTYANIGDFAGALTANAAKGATSIAVDGLGTTDTINAGTIVTFDGTGESYAVTANATMSAGAGTLSVWPALRQAEDNNDTFAISTAQDNDTHYVNLAFHKEAFALAFGMLSDFDEFPNGLGINAFSVQDPSGISVRARIYAVPNSSEVHVALDTLYGVQLINPDLACRVEVNPD